MDTDTPAVSAQSLTADSDKRPTGGQLPATPVERQTQAVSGSSSMPCNHSIINSPSSGHMIAERAGGDRSAAGGVAYVTEMPQPWVKLNPVGGPVINSDKPAPDSRQHPSDGQSVGVVQTRLKAMAKLNDREMTRRAESSTSDDGSRVANGGLKPNAVFRVCEDLRAIYVAQFHNNDSIILQF